MRRLEIAGTIGLALLAPAMVFPTIGREWMFVVLLGISALVIAIHPRIEGYRWQMVPSYLLAIGLAVYESLHAIWQVQAGYIGAVAVLLLTGSSFVLCSLLPVFRLPAPTGPYKVGSQTRHLVDAGRQDPLSERPGGFRELMVQIWYPAEPCSRGRFAPYRERPITTFRSAHFALVESHSIANARFARAPARLPVLLCTPSWSGIRTENMALVEELASHGYVIVGIDHPYSSNSVAFPDGTVVRRKFIGEEDYSSEAAVRAFVETANEQIDIRAADARFVLDTLERLDTDDPQGILTGRLDLEKVGIFGSSLGGGTAVQASLLDHRFKAAADLGGMIGHELEEPGHVAPLLFIFEGMYRKPPFLPGTSLLGLSPSKRREVELSREQFVRMKGLLRRRGGYWMSIDGVKHIHFFDAPFFTPLRSRHLNPVHILAILRGYSVGFFDRHLKGIEKPLLENPCVHVEGVCVENWPRQT